ncbi:transposable element Tcb1 transposase [Trichonephila clavipes]|nr:transposable element Tcb1 transposase [Trichonephila clavipes]
MTVIGRTASSRELPARWSTATGVLMSASSIHRRLLHCGLRQDNAPPHVAKTVRDFCSAEQMHATSFLASYSSDMSPIEQMLDLVDWHFTRYPRPATSKDKFLLSIQVI